MQPITVYIRWMVERDMPAVLDIERFAFRYPWTQDDFQRVRRQRSVIGMIAEYESEIVGYMIYGLSPQRITLLNLAVDPCWQRRTIGRQLMERLCRKLSAKRRREVVVDVDEGNVDAQLFFRALGWRCVSILRGRYANGVDAYRFRYRVHREETSEAGEPEAVCSGP